MKRWITVGSVCAGLVFGGLAGPADGKQEGKRYYFGRGDIRGSGISFVVRAGAVREILTSTGQVPCGADHANLAKAFGAAELNGSAFRRRVIRRHSNDEFLVAGHVRGGSASGRFRSSFGDQCSSPMIRWQAQRVSHDEYKHHCHCAPHGRR
jgi:hypothetical protein